MIKKILLSGLVICLVLALFFPAAAQGQDNLSVTGSSAKMDFPLTLSFSAQIRSNVNITDVRVRYSIDQMSFADIFSEAEVAVESSPNVNANWSLDMRKLGGLPPGSTLRYWWLVKDAGGHVLETAPAGFQVTDDRYQWKNLTQDKISLNWYSGDSSFAQDLMQTAQTSLTKLSKDTGVYPSETINIYIYGNNKDLLGSMIYPQEWTGGVAFTPYNIIAIGIEPGQLTWGRGAMTHELTHIVIYQVVFNPYNDIPVWLNEGLAMYSEGLLSPQFTSPLGSAAARGTLLSVRGISSPFSAYSDISVLSYAESFSLVEYLISNYGSEKMSELLSTFKQGSSFDGAFMKVYGFNLDGLNDLWKPWVKSQYAK
jgi:hypothetical protein